MNTRIFALPALGFALVMSAQAMAQDPNPCQAKLEHRLQEYNLTMADMKSSYWTTFRSGEKQQGPISSYQATLVPKSNCADGELVVRMTSGCYIQDVYTQGTCKVNGVHHFSLF